jgi:hypothetical protein
VIEDLVEMQKRRHDFLCMLDDLSFFPQLAPYLDALREDPRVGAILDDLLLDAQKTNTGPVGRRQRLGGLLSSYERTAA